MHRSKTSYIFYVNQFAKIKSLEPLNTKFYLSAKMAIIILQLISFIVIHQQSRTNLIKKSRLIFCDQRLKAKV